MSDTNNNGGGNSVGIVAIIAILVLAGVGAWFAWGRSGSTTSAPHTTSAKADPGISVKVNLPDSINIK